jgi:hypothetical protein
VLALFAALALASLSLARFPLVFAQLISPFFLPSLFGFGGRRAFLIVVVALGLGPVGQSLLTALCHCAL